MEQKEQLVLRKRCRYCKDDIIFVPNKFREGRFIPVNPDGTRHLCRVKLTVFDIVNKGDRYGNK